MALLGPGDRGAGGPRGVGGAGSGFVPCGLGGGARRWRRVQPWGRRSAPEGWSLGACPPAVERSPGCGGRARDRPGGRAARTSRGVPGRPRAALVGGRGDGPGEHAAGAKHHARQSQGWRLERRPDGTLVARPSAGPSRSAAPPSTPRTTAEHGRPGRGLGRTARRGERLASVPSGTLLVLSTPAGGRFPTDAGCGRAALVARVLVAALVVGAVFVPRRPVCSTHRPRANRGDGGRSDPISCMISRSRAALWG
jgi:hypothetical protein